MECVCKEGKQTIAGYRRLDLKERNSAVDSLRLERNARRAAESEAGGGVAGRG